MSKLCIQAPLSKINTSVLLPGSKSVANRILILNYLRGIKDFSETFPASTDTQILKEILSDLQPEINAGDAGTAFRFLTALLSTVKGTHILSGSSRMHERPIGPLVEALKKAGAKIEHISKNGFPPLRIEGSELTGGTIEIDSSVSSQFVSAMLMIGPLMKNGLQLKLSNSVTSLPYILLTISLMKRLGALIEWHDDEIHVEAGKYSNEMLEIERDWSSAAFWFEVCSLSSHARIEFPGLRSITYQGDSRIQDLMQKFQVHSSQEEKSIIIEKNNSHELVSHVKINCSEIPDLVPALACTCAGLGIEAEFSGVKNLQIKESDRLVALRSGLHMLGIVSEYKAGEDVFHVFPGTIKSSNEVIETFNDHRIAMAFAPLSIVCGEIRLSDGDVVSKSYPEFWNHMSEAGFRIEKC